MRIAIGSDHAGYRLKEHFIAVLSKDGHEVNDLGTDSRGRRSTIRSTARRSAVRSPPGGPSGASCSGERSGRADRGEQGEGRARRAVQRPLHVRVLAPRTTTPTCCRSAPVSWGRAWPTRSSASGSPPSSKAAATSAASTRSPPSRTERFRRDHRIRRPGGDRPRDRRHHPARGRAAEHDDPADRVGELHVAGGARRAGVGAHEQVLRGLPGEALLRRQLRRRRGRGARARPRVRALRRRARQRAAALGRQRQHGRLPRAARARRHGHGDAPRPGRPPHPRLAGELQRSPLRLRRVRRRRRAERLDYDEIRAPRARASGRR